MLIDRLDNGEKLGAGLQNYVDQKLDRLEILMKQLGIYDEEDAELEPNSEDEFKQEMRSKKSKKPASDDDLLSQFEDLDLNDFK